MWDSNSPLQLLNTMPKKLTKENLEKLQLVIDADKYKNSLVSGFDLCGMYAPFCRDCKKTSIYPCAIAYINMMRAGGADIEIDAKPVTAAGKYTEKIEEAPVEERPVAEIKLVQTVSVEPVEETAVAQTEYQPADEQTAEPVTEEVVQADEVVPEAPRVVAETEQQPVRHKIRIAFARKKLY